MLEKWTRIIGDVASEAYYSDESVILFHEDCRTLMPRLPAGIAQTVVADPPYNVGQDNVENDCQTPVQYREFTQTWTKGADHVLRDGGAFFMFFFSFGMFGVKPVLDTLGVRYEDLPDPVKKSVRSAAARMAEIVRKNPDIGDDEAGEVFMNLLQELLNAYADVQYMINIVGWQFLNLIIWEFPNRLPSVKRKRNRFILSYQPIFFYGKGFTRDIVGRLYDIGENGRTDVWRFASPQNHYTGDLQRFHRDSKPLKVADRMLLATTDPAEIVLDPFVGGGTVPVSCKRLGRLCIGADVEAKNLDVTIERLSQSALPIPHPVTPEDSAATTPTKKLF